MHKCFLIVGCSVLVLLLASCGSKESSEWVTLFDGETLKGWTIPSGYSGEVSVENGAITGVISKEMFHLRTVDSYEDFILELEFKIDSGLNSGVQIRSGLLENDSTFDYTAGRPDLPVSKRSFKAGTFAGYQFEIETSDRSWTGGFYEEGGRGWLQPLMDDQPSKKAFRPGDWNHMRIMAQGNHFQSWLNGEQAADHYDGKTSSGFIGFQFHDTRNDDLVGGKVRFKNIRIKEL